MAQEVPLNRKDGLSISQESVFIELGCMYFLKWSPGDSLVVHWLGLGAFTAGAGVPGSIPD